MDFWVLNGGYVLFAHNQNCIEVVVGDLFLIILSHQI